MLTHTMRHTFCVLACCWAPIALILVVGCATVDPKPDCGRASQLIAERTGNREAYDPSADALVAEKVAALLADGLTVDEAVRLALLNSPTLQSIFQEIGASRADVVQAGLLTNPSFSFLAQFPEGGGRTKLTMGFGQELVDLWQIPVRKKIAESQLEQTILKVVQQAVDLTADAKSQAYRLLALQQAEGIANENVALVEKSLKLAQDRFNAGETGQLDVNLVRTSLLETRLQLIDIRRQRRLAETALANTLGLSRWEKPWTLRDDLPMAVSLAQDERAVLLFAMTERLDARATALRVQAAEDEVRQQYLKIFPSVAAGVEWERPDRKALPGRNILADTARESIANGKLTAPSIQSKAQRDAERRAIVDSLLGPSLQITLPIWDQNQAQIAKARSKAEQQRKDYETLLDAVARQVQDALTAVGTAEEEVRFYHEQALPQASANVESTQRTYRAGEKDIIVLIDAQKSLIFQRQAYLGVLRDYAVAMAELERAVGGRLPPTPATQPTSAPSTRPQGGAGQP
jgi:cobalt-zinc-cadmium efflux system outer membrane protein